MSVSKTRSGSKCSGKHSLKESRFRHPVSQKKHAAVHKNITPLSCVKSSSLRDEFIKALKVTDKSDRTIKSYCDAVKMFQNFINKHPLNVTVNDIRAFFFT